MGDRRQHNKPWKHTERDRKWTARVERAKARGEYTPPGTPSNVTASTT